MCLPLSLSLFLLLLLLSRHFLFLRRTIVRYFHARDVCTRARSLTLAARRTRARACKRTPGEIRVHSAENSSAKSTPFFIPRRFRKQYARVEQTLISKWLLNTSVARGTGLSSSAISTTFVNSSSHGEQSREDFQCAFDRPRR